MRIGSNGCAGIGDTSPNYLLDVGGNIRCVDLTETSDGRFKRDVATIDHAPDKVESIRGVSFEWTDEINAAPGRKLGVIAQAVETVVPEVVPTDDAGVKSVDYTKLTAVSHSTGQR